MAGLRITFDADKEFLRIGDADIRILPAIRHGKRRPTKKKLEAEVRAPKEVAIKRLQIPAE